MISAGTNSTHRSMSEAAKARGATGFLKPPHHWHIEASGRGCADTFKTVVKREAARTFARLCKAAADPGGRYTGAEIVLFCDGKEVGRNR